MRPSDVPTCDVFLKFQVSAGTSGAAPFGKETLSGFVTYTEGVRDISDTPIHHQINRLRLSYPQI